MKIIVIGAGLAGLAAAAALVRAGAGEVVVLERAPQLREFGGGIQLSPNAVKALRAIGLRHSLLAAAFAPKSARLIDGASGGILFEAPLAETAEALYDAPYLHIHRGDLMVALAHAALSAGAQLRVAAEAVSLADEGGKVRLRLADGERLEADLAVVADGVGSRHIEAFGARPARRPSGLVAWRGLAPAEALCEPAGGGAFARVAPCANVWVGAGRHLVAYYVRGGRALSFVAVSEAGLLPVPARRPGDVQWDMAGDIDALRAAFADFTPAARAILAAARDCTAWPLSERAVADRWSAGRVVALGDSVHAMAPFMAQGAAMAFEDAAVLGQCLAPVLRRREADGLGPALARYERLRLDRVRRVHRTSWDNRRLFHAGGTEKFLRQGVLRLARLLAPEFSARGLAWLYGYDAEAHAAAA